MPPEKSSKFDFKNNDFLHFSNYIKEIIGDNQRNNPSI